VHRLSHGLRADVVLPVPLQLCYIGDAADMPALNFGTVSA
jgi:hypothetical protein